MQLAWEWVAPTFNKWEQTTIDKELPTKFSTFSYNIFASYSYLNYQCQILPSNTRIHKNSPGTGENPSQMASYAENVSIRWRHHVTLKFGNIHVCENPSLSCVKHRTFTYVHLSPSSNKGWVITLVEYIKVIRYFRGWKGYFSPYGTDPSSWTHPPRLYNPRNTVKPVYNDHLMRYFSAF